jgi:hypothetical protein
MYNDCQIAGGSFAERNPTFFIRPVLVVKNRSCKRIEKNCYRLLESHAMLATLLAALTGSQSNSIRTGWYSN